MLEKNTIRKFPLFKLFIENNHLIVENNDYLKDNCCININDISHLELIRNYSFFDKLILFCFGFDRPAKSDVLRIHLENSFKDIILTNCDIQKVGLIVYQVNHLINEKVNDRNK